MAYGIDDSLASRLKRWQEAGYVPQVMTGVAWGNYQDSLEGKFDGREHWDEGQVNANADTISHGPRVPYMVPSVAFSNYLTAIADPTAVASGFNNALINKFDLVFAHPLD